MRIWLCLLLCLAVGLACAGSGAGPATGPGAAAAPEAGSAVNPPSEADPRGGVASGFPKPDALYELREQPLRPGSPFGTSFRDVGSWQLAGPFPEVAGDASRGGSQPWDPLLDELIRSRAGLAVASASLECFAREAGRFLVEHRALPGLALQRFLAGRCAVVTSPPTFATLRWESSRSLTLADAVAELAEPIAESLRGQAVGGPLDIGMWLHSENGRIELVIARGERSVRLEPVPTAAGTGGEIVLAGEVLQPAASVGAIVTHGRFGWERCLPDEAVALPRFRFECALDAEDPSAWVSLHFLPPGLVLQRSGAQLLIRRAGNRADTYRRHRYAEPRPVRSAAEVPAAFLELLNQVRAQAGAPPLELAAEQTRVASEVAPHYFSALMEPSGGALAELAALGLMAGWEVQELVQEGRFAYMWLVESRDVASLLSDALESPEARMTLLWDELQQIAVGPVAGEDDETVYLGLIAATYQIFSEEQHRRNVSRVGDALTRARAERGRAAPKTLEPAVPLALAAASRIQAGAKPQDVLGQLIQESVDAVGRSVTGWVAETQDLAELGFPEDFLEREALDVAISVSVHRPEGEAWGRYVVLMVAAEPERRRL